MLKHESVKQLHDIASGLGPDERRVLLLLAQRLEMGATHYGILRLATDPRNWRKEASEEALDGMVYLGLELLRDPNAPTRRRLNPLALMPIVATIASLVAAAVCLAHHF